MHPPLKQFQGKYNIMAFVPFFSSLHHSGLQFHEVCVLYSHWLTTQITCLLSGGIYKNKISLITIQQGFSSCCQPSVLCLSCFNLKYVLHPGVCGKVGLSSSISASSAVVKRPGLVKRPGHSDYCCHRVQGVHCARHLLKLSSDLPVQVGQK